MLDINDKKYIREIIKKENVSEFMRVLIKQYSILSVENAQELIQLNSEIANSIITQKASQIKDINDGLFWLMAQREMTDEAVGLFASMVPVCKVYFPQGKCVSGNQAEKKYFCQFVKLFKDKKVFDWEKDLDWAKKHNYEDYLRRVEKENYL